MVTKICKQPNGKYMTFQTTANMMTWNEEGPPFLFLNNIIEDDWEEYCEGVKYNQDFTKEQLEKLIEELPEYGICDYSGFDFYHHMGIHENEKPNDDCKHCQFYMKWQDIMLE